MPVRRKAVNEPKRDELNPYANDVKLAMLQTHQMTIPIERVIYVNDSVNVRHESGTNRYYINFPETWRTTNQKHIIGVRSIQLRHGYGRTFGFDMQFSYFTEDGLLFPDKVKEITIPTPFSFKYSYENDENPNPLEWVTELNNTWKEFAKNFKNIDEYNWQCSYDEQKRLYTLELIPSSCMSYVEKNTIKYSIIAMSPDLYNSDVKFETNKYPTQKTSPVFPDSETPKIIIPGPLETYAEYLVAASFVEQTSHNYLGFTNTTFSPPKYYNISSTDTQFWIDLVSPDGLKPRELPTDGRDMLVIEIQLLTSPNIPKF